MLSNQYIDTNIWLNIGNFFILSKRRMYKSRVDRMFLILLFCLKQFHLRPLVVKIIFNLVSLQFNLNPSE